MKCKVTVHYKGEPSEVMHGDGALGVVLNRGDDVTAGEVFAIGLTELDLVKGIVLILKAVSNAVGKSPNDIAVKALAAIELGAVDYDGSE